MKAFVLAIFLGSVLMFMVSLWFHVWAAAVAMALISVVSYVELFVEPIFTDL